MPGERGEERAEGRRETETGETVRRAGVPTAPGEGGKAERAEEQGARAGAREGAEREGRHAEGRQVAGAAGADKTEVPAAKERAELRRKEARWEEIG